RCCLSMHSAQDLDSLLDPSEPLITTLANAASYIYHSMDRINWAGFYLFDGEKLILGPFQGKPACTTIPIGKGVCGTAASERKTIIVDDVNTFPGHIVCDADSRSEIVLPTILQNGKLFGVMDVDSPEVGRFGADDKKILEEM